MHDDFVLDLINSRESPQVGLSWLEYYKINEEFRSSYNDAIILLLNQKIKFDKIKEYHPRYLPTVLSGIGYFLQDIAISKKNFSGENLLFFLNSITDKKLFKNCCMTKDKMIAYMVNNRMVSAYCQSSNIIDGNCIKPDVFFNFKNKKRKYSDYESQ